MNPYVIAGLLLIAIGTGLTLYGGQKQSRRDNAQVEAKIGNVLERLESAKADPTSDAAQEIDNIDKEFRQWAENFVRNKDRLLLEIEEGRIGNAKLQLAQSERARPVIAHLLKSIERSVNAYNAQAGTAYVVSLPDVPTNMYPLDKRVRGSVSFGDAATWQVEITAPTMRIAGNLPALHIVSMRREATEMRLKGEIDYYIDESKGVVAASLRGDLPNLEGIEGPFPLAAYHVPLQRSIQRFLEAQLLVLQ